MVPHSFAESYSRRFFYFKTQIFFWVPIGTPSYFFLENIFEQQIWEKLTKTQVKIYIAPIMGYKKCMFFSKETLILYYERMVIL